MVIIKKLENLEFPHDTLSNCNCKGWVAEEVRVYHQPSAVIWCCHSCSIGHSRGSGSITGPGTSICQGCSERKKKRKREGKKEGGRKEEKKEGRKERRKEKRQKERRESGAKDMNYKEDDAKDRFLPFPNLGPSQSHGSPQPGHLFPFL